MVTEGKVEAGDVHASVDEFDHLIVVTARLTKSGHDASLPLVEVDLLEDLEPDSARVLTEWLASRFDHIVALTCFV